VSAHTYAAHGWSSFAEVTVNGSSKSDPAPDRNSSSEAANGTASATVTRMLRFAGHECSTDLFDGASGERVHATCNCLSLCMLYK